MIKINRVSCRRFSFTGFALQPTPALFRDENQVVTDLEITVGNHHGQLRPRDFTRPVFGQAGNKGLLIQAGQVVGLMVVNAPVTVEGAGGVQVRAPLLLLNLPAADPHVVGAVWSNAGVLMISAG